MKVLPPAVSVRLAVVNPLRVNVGPPVTASDVLVRTTLVDTLSTRVSAVPLSVPPPVQPVTVKVLPPAAVGEVGGRDSAQAQRRVGGGQQGVGQREASRWRAVTVPVPAGADSDPVPVQPLTVKVLLVALTPVNDATVMPLRLSVKPAPVPVNFVLVSV